MVSEIIQIIDRLSYYATQIKETTNKYLWLELCIIDLTNYKNLPSAENLLNRIQVLEEKLASGNFEVSSAPRINVPVASRSEVEQARPVVPPRPAIQQKPVEPERVSSPIQRETTPVRETSQEAPASIPAPTSGGGNDLHSLWISILQSIDSPPNRAFYSNLAKPVEITDNKVVVAFTKEMFVKQAREGAKNAALVDAVKRYLNVSNPVIEIITSDNIDLSKKVVVPPTPAQKQVEEQNLQKQEEEEYHAFVQGKKEEAEKPAITKPVDSSSQAAMVKELFDGKYIE